MGTGVVRLVDTVCWVCVETGVERLVDTVCWSCVGIGVVTFAPAPTDIQRKRAIAITITQYPCLNIPGLIGNTPLYHFFASATHLPVLLDT